MKIVLDVPDVHEGTGRDMFDVIGELCDANDIAAVMSQLPKEPKVEAPPKYLDFSLTFKGTVEIGIPDKGGWAHDRRSLENALDSMIQRTIDNGGITTDSCSYLLNQSFDTKVFPR